MEPAVARDSAEYAEIIAEVFAETVRKAESAAMCTEDPEATPALMECLQYVYLHGPSSGRDIGSGLQVSMSAASQLVERLVRKGLVTRSENAADRRLTRVELTQPGRKLVKTMRGKRSRWFEAVIGAMPESSRKSFLDGVEGFLKIALARDEQPDRACVRCGMEHVPFCVVNVVKSERREESER